MDNSHLTSGGVSWEFPEFPKFVMVVLKVKSYHIRPCYNGTVPHQYILIIDDIIVDMQCFTIAGPGDLVIKSQARKAYKNWANGDLLRVTWVHWNVCQDRYPGNMQWAISLQAGHIQVRIYMI